MIKIILAEDNAIVRHGIIELLNEQPDMEVVGEAEDALQTLKILENGLQTDIVLTDLNMPGMDGLGLTEKLRSVHPKIKVIILTMHLRADFIQRALQAGAKGYVIKDGNIEQVYCAIRRVCAGESFVKGGL
jgi:DNA-binding NarL/FixJ family response regulator